MPTRLSFLNQYLLEAMEADLDPSTGPREPWLRRDYHDTAYAPHRTQIPLGKHFWKVVEQHPFLSLYDRNDLQDVLQLLWSVVWQKRVTQGDRKVSYPVVDLLRFLNPAIPSERLFSILQTEPEAYWPGAGIAVPWMLFSKNAAKGEYFSSCLFKDPGVFSVWMTHTMAILGHWILMNAFSVEVISESMMLIFQQFLEGSSDKEAHFGNMRIQYLDFHQEQKSFETYPMTALIHYRKLAEQDGSRGKYFHAISNMFLDLATKDRFPEKKSSDLYDHGIDPIGFYLFQREVLQAIAGALLLNKTLPPFPLDGVL